MSIEYFIFLDINDLNLKQQKLSVNYFLVKLLKKKKYENFLNFLICF